MQLFCAFFSLPLYLLTSFWKQRGVWWCAEAHPIHGCVFLVPPVTKLFFICQVILWFSRGDETTVHWTFRIVLNNSMTTLKELFPYNNHCIIDCWTFLQCCSNCNKHSDHSEISLKFINSLSCFVGFEVRMADFLAEQTDQYLGF